MASPDRGTFPFVKDESGHEPSYRLKPASILNTSLLQLKRHYPGIKIQTDTPGSGTLDILGLSPTERANIQLDIDFFGANPELPIENLCSRIDNYFPQNTSQQNLLEWAMKLVELDASISSAGIYMHGQPGIGKTHMAVAIAKELYRKGEKVWFDQAVTSGSYFRRKLEDNASESVFIMDDLNSPYGSGSATFVQALLLCHNKGGRLFVTSNMSFEGMLEGLNARLGNEQFARINDRIQGMLKQVLVYGESMRPKQAWFEAEDTEMN